MIAVEKAWSVVAATMCLLFLETYKIIVHRAGGVTLFKHVTHYGPRSNFPYYNPIIPIARVPHIRHEGTYWATLWI
jgi:hypothetical protein